MDDGLPRAAEGQADPEAARGDVARGNDSDSAGSSDSEDYRQFEEMDNLELDNEHLRDGVRVEIAEQEIPVPEDADGEERRRGPRIELQIQIQLQPPGRANPSAVEYDKSLPTQHTYLGEGFSRVTGGKVYEAGDVCQLPLYHSKAQLMPGRTLPFMCDTPRQQAMVRLLTSGNASMFAVLCSPRARDPTPAPPTAGTGETAGAAAARQQRHHNAHQSGHGAGEQPPSAGDIGCTAELMSYGTSENDDIRAICKGVQRFCLLRLLPQITGQVVAEVQILPDLEPPAYPHHLLAARSNVFVVSPFRPPPSTRVHKPPPAAPAEPRLQQHRQRNITERVAEAMYRALGMAASQAAIARVAAEERAEHGLDGDNDDAAQDNAMDEGSAAVARPEALAGGRHAGLVCSVPLRVFHDASYERVVERVFRELLPWRTPQRLSRHELVPFSFYVLASMPLDAGTQRELLAVDSALLRLQRVLALLLRCRYYCCSRCGRRICRRDNVMSMSDAGPSALYVNPSNVIMEMFTVRDTISFATAQLRPSSTEFSWFPGYSWCSSICISCSNQIGWIFETDTADLTPQQFFGLVQSKVVPDFAAPQRRVQPPHGSAASSQRAAAPPAPPVPAVPAP